MQREEEKASITGSRNRVNMSQAIARERVTANNVTFTNPIAAHFSRKH